MELQNKATSLWPNFFNVRMVQIRTFHMTWFAFFACFFAWFGIAPMMVIVREELGLTKSQVGWTIIASVAVTIFARLFIGWLCDRIGPRLAYTWLLCLGAIPVAGIGLADDFTSFLLFRLAIGVIGASFVITQYHTSVMFAPNVVGTANATSAGWGNLGGGCHTDRDAADLHRVHRRVQLYRRPSLARGYVAGGRDHLLHRGRLFLPDARCAGREL